METQKATPERKVRAKRTPVNGRNVLSVSNKEAGYHYRFVNDVGDRIQDFIERGWEMVEAKDVKVGDRRVNGAGPLGSKAQASVNKDGTKAFVMRIKDDWYQEDQKEKADHVNELEQTMKQQALSSNDLRNGKLEITRA